jgi:hypothetical protein
MSSGTLASFSKFSLNTSNSRNTKVVYFVKGHNFHVEWHCWFEVQISEKLKSTLLVTIHRRPENSHLGIQIVQKWLRKRPYALCESCRGSGDLQLFYSLLGPLLFNYLEFCSVKQGYLKNFRRHWRSGMRRPRRRRASPAPRPRWVPTPRPASVRWSTRRGPRPWHRTAIHIPSPGPTCRACCGRAARAYAVAVVHAAPHRRRTLPCCAPYHGRS